MNKDLEKIQEAAQGLFFLSESDYPFEVVQLQAEGKNEEQLLALAQKPAGTLVEKTTIEYFLRNMTRINPDADTAQHSVAQKFTTLQNTLKERLSNIEVYRIGTIQIDAFIIGKLKDDSIGGLRTTLIET